MADTKTSQLPAVTSTSDADLLAVVQGGVSKKATRAQLLADVPEQARDAVGAALTAGTGIQITVDDVNDKILITNTGSSSGGGGNSTPATVDGQTVSSLAFTSQVGASDVGALPLPSGTPLAGQVPVVSTVSPLALGWGSGGGGGGTVVAADSMIRPQSYGAKGDGVMMTDLAVTAGSNSISAQSAPFTSTAVDAGKIVIWLTGATTETGVIASVQSSSQATLVNNAVAGSVQFGGPNGNGAFGTDNTSAFNQALTAAQAASTAGGSNKVGKTWAPAIYITGGIYLTKALNPITQPNGRIFGDGRANTFICAGIASGTIFQHGTLNTNPNNAFIGTAYNWVYQDLTILDVTRYSTGTENQRTVNGIVDYGNGGIRINRCQFTGLKYGFAGAYGSDFSDIRDSFFSNCDVCYYFGPGSQQVNISKTDCSDSREAAVFEGAPHWHLGDGSSFEDLTQASITIEGKPNGQKTRFGLPSNVGGAFYSGNFIVDGGCWFETNAGNNGRLSPRIILFTGDGPFGIPCEGLTVRDAYVISGGNQQSGGSNTVVEYNSALNSPQPVIIDGLYMSDPSYANSIYLNSGSATSTPLIKNVRKPSNVVLTQGSVNAKYINRDGTYHGFTAV